jgi:purine-binding chemotaxis protein CheW
MAEIATHSAAEIRQFCTFYLAGRLFGFDILTVKEVNTQTGMTPIPHAPPVVRGYVNLRGNVALVLDMRRLLGFDPVAVTADTRLVMLKPSVGESFGVLVDQIGDIATLHADAIENRTYEDGSKLEGSRSAKQACELVQAIGKLDSTLLIILDPNKLLKILAETLGTNAR